MPSIYFSTSNETGLVPHFSGYKGIPLHWKSMSYVLNHDVRFSANRNITKFYRSIYCSCYSDILNKLARIVSSLCFKKQTL